MKIIYNSIVLIVASSLFFSCSKSTVKNINTNSCTLDFSNIAGSFKISSKTFQYNSQSPVQDVYATWSPCKQDDIWNYNFDSSITFVDQIVCSPSQLPPFNKWEFRDNTIYFKDAGGSYLDGYQIIEFSCSTMKCQQIDNLGSVTTTIFTRQ